MNTRWISRYGAVLAALLYALSACGSAEDAAMAEYAPQQPDAAIQAVNLGTSDSERFDFDRTGTEFPDGTDRVLVWYRWDGADAGTRMDNRWWLGERQVLSQGEVVNDAAGNAAWLLMMDAGSPLPNGSYRVELLENGTVVTTIPFNIGS
jgi:hypothetical protein